SFLYSKTIPIVQADYDATATAVGCYCGRSRAFEWLGPDAIQHHLATSARCSETPRVHSYARHNAPAGVSNSFLAGPLPEASHWANDIELDPPSDAARAWWDGYPF